MRYINPTTRIKLNKIIGRVNEKKFVSLKDRIFLSKYSSTFPHINEMIRENSLKSS